MPVERAMVADMCAGGRCDAPHMDRAAAVVGRPLMRGERAVESRCRSPRHIDVVHHLSRNLHRR